MSLKNFCFDHIKDSFYKGKFAQTPIIIDKETGFFNASALCKKKSFSKWYRSERTRNLISCVKDSFPFFYFKVRLPRTNPKNIEITGIYLHDLLLENLLNWLEQSFDYLDSFDQQNCNYTIAVITNKLLNSKNIYMVEFAIDVEQELIGLNSNLLVEYSDLFYSKQNYKCYESEAFTVIKEELLDFKIRNTRYFKVDFERLDNFICNSLDLLTFDIS